MENEINSHNELRKSDVGPRVQELHRMLKSLDYEIDEQSETFSHETESAIKEFQEHRGLDPSGICDQKTWDLLVENSYVLGDRLCTLGDQCYEEKILLSFNVLWDHWDLMLEK